LTTNGRPAVIALGEALAEFMRPVVGLPLEQAGPFEGPFASGAPGNFAHGCARLGLAVGFIGTVGDDAFGRMFRARLAGEGIDLTYLAVDPERTTGTSFVTYRNDGGRDFLFHIKDAAAGRVPDFADQYFAGARLVHITGSTLAGGPELHAACVRAATLGKKVGALVSFDPNLRPELLGSASVAEVVGPIVALADVILPSGDELRFLTGIDDLAAAARSLLDRGVRWVFLKRGAEGSTLIGRDVQVEVATERRVERDPTGAGDAFAAGAAYGLLHGLPYEDMLRLANTMGGFAVTKLGPMEATPNLAEALRVAGLAEEA
jgi:sugar/nucleoside kinase (ribokinase family)